jgi:fructose-1,6-bisphosphatase/inositol monophosphatase family enzyme
MENIADFVEPIRRLHDRIRGLVVAACEDRSADELRRAVYDGAGDVIYAIDRVSEDALVESFTDELARHEPIVFIGEGLLGGRMALPEGVKDDDARWRVIVDPIDGTRGLMYQKRPAWILTGVAPNRGEATSLADIELAVQTEIPLVKQHLCDQLWAVRGNGVSAVRHNRLTGESRQLDVEPSRATDLRHGFATICRFFPGGRDLLAAIDEELCDRVLARKKGEVGIFEDQYACTGGQLYALATGQDRFVADLRPLVQRYAEERGIAAVHCCHPYDLCAKLIAEEAGIVVTAPGGGPIQAPLDTETNVGWVGYANRHVQMLVGPVLNELLQKHGLLGPI